MGQVIHMGGLLPPSFGPATTRCGRKLPMTRDHFLIFGVRRPNGSRLCKACEKSKSRQSLLRWIRETNQKERNRRISEGLRLAWARRKAAQP